MSPTTAFLADLALVALACTGMVAYVSKHLRILLIELCGTAERANFWLAFSNVALIVVPLIFALNYNLEVGPGKNMVFEMAGQIKYGLVGFVLTLTISAILLFRFIPTPKSGVTTGPIP
jgi:tetrahydromethanopterin S-methyltransferase subunit B